MSFANIVVLPNTPDIPCKKGKEAGVESCLSCTFPDCINETSKDVPCNDYDPAHKHRFTDEDSFYAVNAHVDDIFSIGNKGFDEKKVRGRGTLSEELGYDVRLCKIAGKKNKNFHSGRLVLD